jgi:hypothetical protein
LSVLPPLINLGHPHKPELAAAGVSALVHGGGCEEVGRLLGFGMLGVEEGGEGLRLREQMTDRIGHLDGSSYSRQSRFHLIIGPELVAA